MKGPKPMTKLYSFDDHPEHREMLGPWAQKWIDNAFSTEPADRAVMTRAVGGLYAAADLPAPLYIGFVKSPLAMALTASAASMAWQLREEGVSELVITGAVFRAVTFGMRVGMGNTAPDSEITVALAAAGVEDATISLDPPHGLVTRMLEECREWWQYHDGGSDWSAWPAYLSFFRHVAKLDLPIYDKWQHYEDAALYGGPRMMHEKFCIVSDRQTSIHLDAGNQLHCEDGPAKTYGDGWALNYWHGIAVPEDFFSWDTKRVLAEENAEIRRCGIERIGWDQFTDQLTLVAEAPDPGNAPHLLRLFDLPEEFDLYDGEARILVAVNSSLDKGGHRRVFGLPVPAHHTDPVTAAAELFGVPRAAYVSLERTT